MPSSVGNLTPTVVSHNTVTERQLVGFGNLWFYTFKKDICSEKCYLIYLVKIIQQSIRKIWKNNNIISQLNQWKLCVVYPQTVHDPSCCWQHKSCYSNILLVCLSWTSVSHGKGQCQLSNSVSETSRVPGVHTSTAHSVTVVLYIFTCLTWEPAVHNANTWPGGHWVKEYKKLLTALTLITNINR